MGRLFTGSGTFTLNPETTLATFENGTVYSAKVSFAPGGGTLMYYNSFREGARIYRSMTSGLPNQLAWCDKFGRIEANGTLLGYCEDGEVRDSDRRVIAYYEGDAYGAAAAACAVLFSLSDTAQTATSDDTAAQATASSEASSDSDGPGVLTILLGLLVMLCMALWKLIKTLPFWGPYVFTGLFGLIIASVASVFVGLLLTVPYLVFHTWLLLRCRRREGRWKYLPVVISFLISATFEFLVVTVF